MQLSDSDLLKFAVENGIIDMKAVQEQINMNERKNILTDTSLENGKEVVASITHIFQTRHQKAVENC